MNLYIYKLALKEKYLEFSAWDAAVQQSFKNHATHLEKMVKSGQALMVGRTDTQLKDNYGIVVFTAKDEGEARRVMEADPIIVDGIMTAHVLPFKLLMVHDEAKKWNVW